jgi:uncharacterized OsmC-like protein
MADGTVAIRNLHGKTAAVGWSNGRAVSIDRTQPAGGMGIGFSGGELLLLAVGGCYCNDLYREAEKMDIEIKNVEIEVSCDWGGTPVRAQDICIDVRVESTAPTVDVERLIKHAYQVAEVPNSLRKGTEVHLKTFKIVGV